MTPTLRILVTIAARNLIAARRRTFFLGGALALVTTLLVLLLSLSGGISDNIVRSATTLTTGHVNVAGFFKATPSDAAPLITQADRITEITRRTLPDVDYVVQRGRGWARVVSPTSALQSLIVGVNIDQEPQLLQVIELAPQSEYVEGGAEKILGDADGLSRSNTAILFATQAERLEVKVGDKVTLRAQNVQGQANTIDVTIVAVARDIGLLSNFSVFVPNQVVRDLYRLKPDTAGAVQVYLKDIDDAPQAMVALRAALEGEGFEMMEYQAAPFFAKFGTVRGEDWVGQKLDLTTWEDEVEFLTWILTALDTVSLFLITILVVIIAVGVMNTMWIAVRRRTREIGTLRAVGMSRLRVWAMFVLEAAMLGLVASTIGALCGVAIALTINALHIQIPIDAVRAILLSDTLRLSVRPSMVASAIGALTLFTVLSALWPSIKAARLQPVEAIHQTE